MILQRFNWRDVSPLQRLLTLHGQLDNLFHCAWGQADGSGFEFVSSAPALDLFEEKDSFTVKVELPGMKKEDIAISLDDGVLTVSGERKANTPPDGATFVRRETTPGRFERNVTLPSRVDAEKIKAAYTDGVLSITLPRAEEAKPKQIPVDIK